MSTLKMAWTVNVRRHADLDVVNERRGCASYVSGQRNYKLIFSFMIRARENVAQLTTSASTSLLWDARRDHGTPVSVLIYLIKAWNPWRQYDDGAWYHGEAERQIPNGLAGGDQDRRPPARRSIRPESPSARRSPLLRPERTSYRGFGDGTEFGAMQLKTTQPIIIEAGATAVFPYVDVNFKGRRRTARTPVTATPATRGRRCHRQAARPAGCHRLVRR